MANLGCEWLDLPKILRDYGVQAVVETGTGWGGSLDAVMTLQGGVKPLSYYGCDTDRAALIHCAQRWPQAVLQERESLPFLTELLSAHAVDGSNLLIEPLSVPTLFWLDAHSFAPGPEGFPLYAEMELIARCKPRVAFDAILCDDIRVIADVENPRYRKGELDVPYLRDEYPWRAYTDLFSKTHRTVVFNDDEGVLAFLPVYTVYER